VRSLQLARIAAQAEFLRLRQLLRRQATRAAFGLAAAVFLLAALTGVHVAGAMALAERFTPVQAVLIVAGIDAAIAIVLAVFAARDVPSPVELEALRLRRTAVDQAVDTELLAALFGRLRRVRSVRGLFDLLVTALAAWLLGIRR
jgi:hypothetical protein